MEWKEEEERRRRGGGGEEERRKRGGRKKKKEEETEEKRPPGGVLPPRRFGGAWRRSPNRRYIGLEPAQSGLADFGRRDYHWATRAITLTKVPPPALDKNTFWKGAGRQANGTMLEECEQEEG